jgi:hypothetical protein
MAWGFVGACATRLDRARRRNVSPIEQMPETDPNGKSHERMHARFSLSKLTMVITNCVKCNVADAMALMLPCHQVLRTVIRKAPEGLA